MVSEVSMLEDNPLKIEKGRSQLNADSIPNSNNIIDIRNNKEYYVNKIELLKHKIENNEYNGQEFLELMQSELFSITDSKISGYYINEIENNFYKFRLSNHKAIISDRQGERTLEESVVIQFCDNKGRVGPKGRLIEFYYNPENLTKEKMISIINGIQDWIKTYAAEIEKLITNSEYEKEIPNKDSAKKDIEKFKYYYVPVWINNRAYNVLLECGVLKENEPSEMQACKEASNEHITESSTNKYIRKNGRLQVADISYLYNLRNRPLFKKIEEKQKIIEEKDKELNIWTAKAEKDEQTIIKLQDELDQKNRLLYGKTELEINCTKRIFSEGLFNGIKKAITRLDEANEKIKKLNFINRNQNDATR